MGKSVHDDVLDAAHNYVISNCTRVTVCDTEPTSYVQANATYALSDVTVDSADFSIEDNAAAEGGRKLVLAAQSGLLIDASGNGQHIALLDVTNSKLLRVTSCALKAMVAGEYINIPSIDFVLEDPV